MIKILIVDDSPTEMALLKELFQAENDMKVVGCATNGEEAIKMIPELKPDIITMDIQMPILNGLEATRIIMSQFPTPIVVITSALSESMNTSFAAMEAGALSVLPKPSDIHSETFNKETQCIVQTVRTMSSVQVIRRRFHTKSSHHRSPLISTLEGKKREYELVAIGTSIGGPQVLKKILGDLAPTFPVPIVVVQHMTPGFIEGFTNWLNNHIELHVKCAENNEVLVAGTVYFAPDHHHLQVKRRDNQLIAILLKEKPIAGFCPSATALFNSVAKVCGRNAVGILLTGMGNDGAHGLLELKKAHGHTFIQDPESAVVFGMAGVAQSLGAVDKVVELNQIASYLKKLISKV